MTPALADELLEALSAGQQFELPPAPAPFAPSAPASAYTPALPAAVIADAAAVLASISAPSPALDSVAPPPSAFESVVPPAPAFDTVPPPAAEPSRSAAMPWDSLPAPATPAAAAMPWDSEPAPQPAAADVTAQSIVAAFDAPEPEAPEHDTLESSPAPELNMEPAPHLELNARSARRGEWSGSRRPDLNELLDQPLDALDFERSEQTDVVQTELPKAEEAAAAHSESNGAGATTPPSSGDDFEILVDDEILEIAEDDVELMDDENS